MIPAMPQAANGVAPSVPTAVPRPRRMHPEHWFILALMAALMCLCLGWGLPDQERLQLLNYGQEPTPQELKRIFGAREAYYETLDAVQAEAGRRASCMASTPPWAIRSP